MTLIRATCLSVVLSASQWCYTRRMLVFFSIDQTVYTTEEKSAQEIIQSPQEKDEEEEETDTQSEDLKLPSAQEARQAIKTLRSRGERDSYGLSIDMLGEMPSTVNKTAIKASKETKYIRFSRVNKTQTTSNEFSTKSPVQDSPFQWTKGSPKPATWYYPWDSEEKDAFKIRNSCLFQSLFSNSLMVKTNKGNNFFDIYYT